MIFEMKKFGLILNSRPAGKEAVLRVKQIANGTLDNELIFDFSGVEVLTPSFADELSHGVKELYSDKTLRFRGYEGNTVIEDVLKKLNLI
jgi:hypothetical protein